MHQIAPIHTGHGCTAFQPFSDHHEFFAVCSSCRYTIPLPVISGTDEGHRLLLGWILPVALLRRGVPGLGRHGLRWILGLGHGERRDETQRGHGASNCSADILKHGCAPYPCVYAHNRLG